MNSDIDSLYISHVAQPYGRHYAACVGRFQEGFLADGVVTDIDEAFARAVDVCERMIDAIKARAAILA